MAIADLDHERAVAVAAKLAACGAQAHGNVAFNNAGVFTVGTLEQTRSADFSTYTAKRPPSR